MKRHTLKTISRDIWFLLATGVGFFLLRFPSLFEPYWYGDEGIYQVIGMALRHGELLYRDIYDNKPPLLYIVYAAFNGDQFSVRFFSLVVGLLTVIVFFWVSKLLFASQKKQAQKITYTTTALFAFLFSIPFLEGNIANAENFMLLPTLLAAYLVLRAMHKKSWQTLFVAGILLSVSFLFKIVAIFDLAAFAVFYFLSNYPKDRLFKHREFLTSFLHDGIQTAPLVIGFMPLVLMTVVYFFLAHALPIFISAIFVQNVGYVNYGNQLIIPQGLLIIKMLLLLFIVVFLFLRRVAFSRESLFIFLWLSFGLFDAFFSNRPYTHYVLVVLPSFVLCVGLIFWSVQKISRLAALCVLISFVLLATNFTYYVKTPLYYSNFLSYLVGKKSTGAYQAFFDRNTPGDYEIASYINSHASPSDGFFLWGNNAMLYKMTNKLPPSRYTVAYHVTACDAIAATGEAFAKQSPRFVVVMGNVAPFPYPLYNYTLRLSLNKAAIYERN